MLKRRASVIDQVLSDVNLAMMMYFVVLFAIAMVFMNPVSKKGDLEIKAEFIVTLTWPDEDPSDVDLVVGHPTGVTYFGNRNFSGVSLDRDDRGSYQETVRLSDGSTHVLKDNWEHIFIREMIPGRYTVNALMFNLQGPPVTVNVKVERLNPYKTIISKDIELYRNKQEETVINFELTKSGKIVNTSATKRALYQKLPSKRNQRRRSR